MHSMVFITEVLPVCDNDSRITGQVQSRAPRQEVHPWGQAGGQGLARPRCSWEEASPPCGAARLVLAPSCEAALVGLRLSPSSCGVTSLPRPSYLSSNRN